MEGDAVGFKAEPVGVLKDVWCHFRVTAEFSGKRPFCSDPVTQDAAEDFGARCNAGDFFNFFDGVDREEPDAKRKGTCNVLLLLDRIAIGNAGGICPGCQNHFNFCRRCTVKGRPKAFQKVQDLRRRIGFHRVIDRGVRQRLGESFKVLAHNVQIDHNAWAIFVASSQEVADTLAHGEIPFPILSCSCARRFKGALQFLLAGAAKARTGPSGVEPESGLRFAATVGRCAADRTGARLSRVGNAVDWIGKPNRTSGKDVTSASSVTPEVGHPGRDQKGPLYVVAFKPSGSAAPPLGGVLRQLPLKRPPRKGTP